MILQRYILRELVATALMAFLTISMVIFLGFGIQQYHRLEGLGFSFLVQTAPFLFCHALTFSLPAACLMASVLVFGRLSAENEITAIRAAGIPLWHAVNPALLLGLVLSLLFLLFNDHVAPRAVKRQRLLARTSLTNSLASPPPLGTSLVFGDNRILYTRFRDDAFQDLCILRVADEGGGARRPGGPRPVVRQEAEILWTRRSRFEPGDGDRLPRFRLEDVTWLHVLPQKPPADWPVSTAQSVEYPLDVAGIATRPLRLNEMPTVDLCEVLRTSAQWRSPEAIQSIRVERHQRIAWALGPFVLTLFGASIGILLRRGSRLAGFGASLPAGIPYFLMATLGQAFAEKAHLPALLSVWIADALFAAIGFVLLWRACRI